MVRAPIDVETQDALPESDRLSDFPHPRHTENLYGHDAAWEIFGDAVASGRLHHAWLLTGPMGIGKATFAYRAARALLEKGGPGDLGGPQSARLVAGLAHPRLMVIRRPYDTKTKKFTASIPVDEVRKLRPFVSKTADGDSWRVVIIDHANDLNHAAANALLKVLEEPPKQTVFLLIAPQPGILLATIRSRCRTLPFEPLRGTAFANAVNQAVQARDHGETAELVQAQLEHFETITDGSVARTLMLAEQGGQQLIDDINTIFLRLPTVDWTAVRAFADDIAAVGQDARFRLATDLIFHRLSALTRARVTRSGPQKDVTLADKLIDQDEVASWAELWERGGRDCADVMSLNLDRKALILDLFSQIATASKNANAGETGPSNT